MENTSLRSWEKVIFWTRLGSEASAVIQLISLISFNACFACWKLSVVSHFSDFSGNGGVKHPYLQRMCFPNQKKIKRPLRDVSPDWVHQAHGRSWIAASMGGTGGFLDFDCGWLCSEIPFVPLEISTLGILTCRDNGFTLYFHRPTEIL